MEISTQASGESLADAVQVAPGLAMWPVTVTATDVNGYDVVVEVVPSEGRLVAREVRVTQRPDGPPVTGESLRSVQVAMLTKQAARHVLTFQEHEGYIEMSPRILTAETVEEIHESGPTRRALEWVAYLYRVAVLMGEPPTKAVESALQLPRSTAGRWVAQARQEGHLGPAEGPGKAGG
jgi:hypothetical protein